MRKDKKEEEKRNTSQRKLIEEDKRMKKREAMENVVHSLGLLWSLSSLKCSLIFIFSSN